VSLVVDRRFVARLLNEIETQVALLHQAEALGDAAFSDPLRRNGVYYTLQSAIEGVVAVCHHLIAQCNFPPPERNLDTISILAEHGVLTDQELVQRLPAMIRFRNLVVHRYWQVEPERVREIIATSLPDFELFCSQVLVFLENNQDL